MDHKFSCYFYIMATDTAANIISIVYNETISCILLLNHIVYSNKNMTGIIIIIIGFSITAYEVVAQQSPFSGLLSSSQYAGVQWIGVNFISPMLRLEVICSPTV